MLFIGNNQREDQFDLHRMCSFKEPCGLSSYGVRGCVSIQEWVVGLFLCVCMYVCMYVCVQAVECSVLGGTECRCGWGWWWVVKGACTFLAPSTEAWSEGVKRVMAPWHMFASMGG